MPDNPPNASRSPPSIRLSVSRSPTRRPHVPRAPTQQTTAALGAPDGAIGEEAAEYLEEFAGTHRHQHHDSARSRSLDDSEEEEEEDEVARRKALPWYKRPSPWWLICTVPFSAIAKSSSLAPRTELYTMLACRVHKPDIFNESYTLSGPDIVSLSANNKSNASLGPRALYDLPLGFGSLTTTIPSPIEIVLPDLVLPLSLTSEKTQRLEGRAMHMKGKPASPCAADPTVRAAVARLTAVYETTMGVLSLLTTGWWGAFADRHGRVTILAISLVGLLITDFSTIVVYYFAESLPGNYWFVMFGAVLEGLLGGFSTAVASQHAYIAETSTDATRARYLSQSLGLMFTGMAFGPTIGSLLIRATGVIISVFWLTLGVHLLYAILIFFGLPEPLSKRRMLASRKKYAEELRVDVEERAANGSLGWKVQAKRLFRFLSPLSILMPDFVDNDRKPLKTRERDWTLALLAIAYGFTISIMASFSYIFQFAFAAFGWSSETLGYWLSFVGAGRAVWLVIVLPLAIKLFKAKPIVIEIPTGRRRRTSPDSQEASEPLLSSSSSSDAESEGEPIRKEIHSPRFELGVARLSLAFDIAAYALMIAFASQKMFWLFGLFSAMGIGLSPAMQTLALAMYSRRGGAETGRLFGAISVVQALAAQILGPAVYGFVYIRTVAIFPRAIFLACLLCIITSSVLMSFVRLPSDEELERELWGMHYAGDEEEEVASAGLVGADSGEQGRVRI